MTPTSRISTMSEERLQERFGSGRLVIGLPYKPKPAAPKSEHDDERDEDAPADDTE